MKKIFCLIVSVVAVARFAIADVTAPEFQLEYPNEAAVSTSGGNAIPLDFGNGVVETFAYVNFYTSVEPLSQVIAGYSTTRNTVYGQIYAAIPGQEKVKLAQANSAIAKWESVMQRLFFYGLAEQSKLDAKAINEAMAAGEEAAVSVAQVSHETSERFAAMNGSLTAQLAALSQSHSTEISQLSSAISTTKDELKTKTTQLNEAIKSNSDSVRLLNAEKKQLSVRVAALEKALNEMKGIPKFGGGGIPGVDIKVFSNELGRVTQWLGSTNVNAGAFIRPLKLDETKYGDGDTILNWLDDMGYVQYFDAQKMNMTAPPHFNKYRFWESVVIEEGISKTNVSASFNAPKTWADNGETIIVTNGHFTVVGGRNQYKGYAVRLISESDESSAVIGVGAVTNNVYISPYDEGENPSVEVNVATNSSGEVILKLGAFYK